MFMSVGSRIRRRDIAVIGEVQMSADWSPTPATVNTTPAKAPYDTVVTDIGGANWDKTNSRFNPKVAGYYWMSIICYTANSTFGAGQVANARVLKNGNAVPACLSGTTNSTSSLGVGLGFVFMNGSTDYLELYLFSQATTPVFGSTWTSPFRIALIK